jgi:hypothetical protein
MFVVPSAFADEPIPAVVQDDITGLGLNDVEMLSCTDGSVPSHSQMQSDLSGTWPRGGDQRNLANGDYTKASLTVVNSSDKCSYKVGIAAYKKVENLIWKAPYPTLKSQILFDYEDIVIGPGEMQTLEIDLPSCATQIDAYYGEVIEDFGSDLPADVTAITFGNRKISYFHTNTGKGDSNIPLCEKPAPPVESCTVDITGLVDSNGEAIGGLYTKNDISSVSAVVEGEPTEVILALIGPDNTETFTAQGSGSGTYTWDDGNILGNLSNGDYTLKATTYDGEEMCGMMQTGFVVDNPTAVTLQSFDTQVQDEQVTILWETASETDNAGFNIYRAMSEEGPFVKINESLIIADGRGAFGASYEFVDEPGAGTYFYKIEDVDLSGFITDHDTMMIETVVDELIIHPTRRPNFRPMSPTELGL